ncbi:DUF2087 domain-containing protein [Algicella marina]|uniref:DUF2087 domain-containing protein n=1 Tax=Algicella marina TaxID=2683284 RepID=A0A6P1T0A6_9RHOB|nr:DUF2087 domain-containing protein [Algicella marina]QHQ33932.1 DUF2087 domain-containing protein [Algicella marina]
MSRQPIPLAVADISSFARALAQQMNEEAAAPSHLSLMNMLARAAGFRNYQHLRAAHAAGARLETPVDESADFRLVERALQQFDDAGRMLRWPSRRAVQELCLWRMWADLPAGKHLHEREVNAILDAGHHFGDAAILRRSLVGMGLLTRNADGSDYLRLEMRPPAEARDLIRRVAARRAPVAVG